MVVTWTDKSSDQELIANWADIDDDIKPILCLYGLQKAAEDRTSQSDPDDKLAFRAEHLNLWYEGTWRKPVERSAPVVSPELEALAEILSERAAKKGKDPVTVADCQRNRRRYNKEAWDTILITTGAKERAKEIRAKRAAAEEAPDLGLDDILLEAELAAEEAEES